MDFLHNVKSIPACVLILYYRMLADNSYVDNYGLGFAKAFCSLVSPETYMSLNLLQYALGSLEVWKITGIAIFMTEYILDKSICHLRVLGLLCCFYSIFDGKSYEQTV